ncbi:MAG: hypothetical protein FWH41_03040 [Treponema sp.]|nr:hypothetical protein [Treponema sp.]
MFNEHEKSLSDIQAAIEKLNKETLKYKQKIEDFFSEQGSSEETMGKRLESHYLENEELQFKNELYDKLLLTQHELNKGIKEKDFIKDLTIQLELIEEWKDEALKHVSGLELEEAALEEVKTQIIAIAEERKKIAEDEFAVKEKKNWEELNEYFKANNEELKKKEKLLKDTGSALKELGNLSDFFNKKWENALKETHQKHLDNIEAEKEALLIKEGFMTETVEESELDRLNAKLKAAQEAGDRELEIKLQYDIEKENAEIAFNEKIAKIEYANKVKQYGWTLSSAIADGAASMLTTMRDNPLWFGLPAWIATGAKIATQLAVIHSQKPEKNFATGGIVPGSSLTGDRVPASLNSREGVFTLDDQEYLFDQIQNRRLGDSMNATIVVTLDSREIARSTVDLVNDGFYTIKTRALR